MKIPDNVPDRWQQIGELYRAARERGPAALAGVDPEMRREVEALLEREPATELLESTQLEDSLTFGPYRVDAKLGEGGMGEVYRAVDTRLGRTVALKVVRAEMADRPGFRERLLREARAVSALNHPHVCTLHDIGEHNGVPYLVMEYVEGETLSARLRQGPLPAELAFRYGAQAASALAAAHARGIVHRDLKPSNLMLTAFGIKVLDFGLAKFGTASDEPGLRATAAHMVVGTPAYMSPEQARGEELDGRSDIFALGCVLYEAASGRAPFRGSSVLAILTEIATATPPPPSTLRPELPAELDSILARALAKDREQRYASAAELEQALTELRSPRATVAAPQEREPDPLVGREREMQKLEALLEKAANGTGGMVLLMGAPGMGKTALTSSFLYSAVRRSPELLVGRGACVEQYGTGEAYLPFLDALAGLLSGAARERVAAVLRRQAPTWCLQFPAVFSASSIENLQIETIGANKDRMLRELGDALGELATIAPMVLLLEDLHWADPASVDLLRHLGQRVQRQRLLIVGTARPEEMERDNHPLRNCKRELQGHGICEEIILRQLGEGQTSRYLDVHFAPHAFPPEFGRLIYRKTEGHPLFLAGAIQFLTERGEIAQRDGTWVLTKVVSGLDLQVPESVQNMIRKQLDVLEEDDRRALQYASIEGEEFTSAVLAALLDVKELDLEEQLARIEKIHRLIRTSGEEELPNGSLATRYRFAHALYQNMLYEDLLSKRRTLLHRQAGETLVQCYGKETARIAAALATHFERGRDFPSAIEYLTQAADVALSRYASDAAEEYCSRALLLTEKLPLEERTRAEIALFHKRGRNRQAAYRTAEAASDFITMLERARAAGDPAGQCMALIALGFNTWGTHEIAETTARARDALAIAEQIGHQGLQAISKMFLGSGHVWVGELEAAKPFLDEGVGLARQANDPQALTAGFFMRGAVHFFQSEYQLAERMFQESNDMASIARDGLLYPMGQLFLGWILGNQGRMSEALAVMEQAKEQSLRNGNLAALGRIPNSIAWIYSELQDFETAARLNREAAETAHRHGVAEGEANSHVNLISDHTHRGKFEDAMAAMSDAKATYDHDPWMHWRYFGTRLPASMAEHWLLRGDPDQAAGYTQTLLENSERTVARKYIALAHKLRAEIALARGDKRAAESEYEAALEVLRDYPTPLVAWKLYASLGRLQPEAYTKSAVIIEQIAANVQDERLRNTFLNSRAVQEVVRQKH